MQAYNKKSRLRRHVHFREEQVHCWEEGRPCWVFRLKEVRAFVVKFVVGKGL